jgi:hypothetical protein
LGMGCWIGCFNPSSVKRLQGYASVTLRKKFRTSREQTDKVENSAKRLRPQALNPCRVLKGAIN